MKKPKKTQAPVSYSTITATLAQPKLLVHLVEKLADRRAKQGLRNERVQPGWMAVDTSTIEAYVSGDIGFVNDHSSINVPFATSFLFTCTMSRGQRNRLAWASSLS